MHIAHTKPRDHDVQTKGQAPEVYLAEQAAHQARIRGEKELQLAAGNIQAEYRRRLEDTKDLASRIEKQLGAVRAEIAVASMCRAHVVAVLTQVQCPLQLTMDWTTKRADARPQTPSADDIKRALTQSTRDLKAAIDTLTSELLAVDRAMAQLKQCERRFVDELKSKASTMVLDRACLEGAVSSPRFPNPPDSNRVPRALMATRGMHTDNEWRNHTHASLSAGVLAVEDSMATRKAVAVAIKSMETNGRTTRPAVVVDALRAHAKYEQQQLTALRYNARMVCGEIAALDKQHGTVAGTLEKVRQQLAQAEQRLGLQTVRPKTESSRKGVEETLEIEVINMRRNEQTLLAQQRELDSKRQRLVLLHAQIATESSQRSGSLQLDQRCANMPLPGLPQIAERYKAKPSPRDSPRAPH